MSSNVFVSLYRTLLPANRPTLYKELNCAQLNAFIGHTLFTGDEKQTIKAVILDAFFHDSSLQTVLICNSDVA